MAMASSCIRRIQCDKVTLVALNARSGSALIGGIVSCEDVGPYASCPVRPMWCFARRYLFAFLVLLVVAVAKVTGEIQRDLKGFSINMYVNPTGLNYTADISTE